MCTRTGTIEPLVRGRSGLVSRKDLSAARALLLETIAMDAHIDTVLRVVNMGADLSVWSNAGKVDIPRLCEGGRWPTVSRFTCSQPS